MRQACFTPNIVFSIQMSTQSLGYQWAECDYLEDLEVGYVGEIRLHYPTSFNNCRTTNFTKIAVLWNVVFLFKIPSSIISFPIP